MSRLWENSELVCELNNVTNEALILTSTNEARDEIPCLNVSLARMADVYAGTTNFVVDGKVTLPVLPENDPPYMIPVCFIVSTVGTI